MAVDTPMAPDSPGASRSPNSSKSASVSPSSSASSSISPSSSAFDSISPLTSEPDGRKRHALKARAIVESGSLAGHEFKRGRITARIIDGPVIDERGLVSVTVSVFRDGKDITPPDLNPMEFYNSPLLVPDPAGDIVRTGKDAQGNEVVRKLRSDPQAAFLSALRETLRNVMGG